MAEVNHAPYWPWLSRLPKVFFGLGACQLLLSLVLFWQMSHRHQPPYYAVSPNGNQMTLQAHDDPSLLPGVVLSWASRAAVAAYTFDFVNYQKQSDAARQWFTPAGWADYQASLVGLIETITSRQLFVNSVVSSPPVIANSSEGEWNIQLPFLVTYQSSETATRKQFLVRMKIVKVRPSDHPSGIGVEGFIMGAG